MSTDAILLKAQNVRMAQAGSDLFRNVDFTINGGEHVGLVGPNGVGKTTLLEVAAGHLRPTEGEVLAAPADSIGYLRQQLPLSGTVAEQLGMALEETLLLRSRLRCLEAAMASDPSNAKLVSQYGTAQIRFEQLNGWAHDNRVAAMQDELGISGLDLNVPFRTLSGGQKARVLMATIALQGPDILLLDEPTNHLDREGARWLSSFLDSFSGALLLVSHDRQFLDDTVHRIIELDGIHPGLQTYAGSYTYYRDEKQRRRARLLADYEAQQKKERRLKEDVRRTKEQARYVERSTHTASTRRYAKKVAKKAKSRERRLERQRDSTSWIAEPTERQRLDWQLAGSTRKGQLVVRVQAPEVSYGTTKVLGQLDMRVWGRDRVIVSGVNGSGKTSLLRLLAGELRPAQGQVAINGQIGYLPQVHDELPMRSSVLEYFRLGLSLYEHEARSYLGHFLFQQEQLRQPLSKLSSGELRRLLLAKLMNMDIDILLLDEPTNFLDFDSIDVVESALADFHGTLIIATHDGYLARNVSGSRFWHVANGSVRETTDF